MKCLLCGNDGHHFNDVKVNDSLCEYHHSLLVQAEKDSLKDIQVIKEEHERATREVRRIEIGD